MIEPDFLRTTRASYDAVAADYAQRFHDELATKPLDRALLAAFAELVRAADDRPVADLGCGHGHVTARLQALGLDAFGIDLSPRMVALARQSHPGLRFDEGSMTALDLPDGGLGGIVALYSIIHIPEERLPAVFAEFYRVLAPGGHALLAFQVGDEQVRRTEAFGHQICLDHYLRPPDRIAELLSRNGLVEVARMLRERDERDERVPRAYLLARKPADVSSS
ncbi:class I SAM-dependent DNA methyltransferase [Nonomuraea sp. H19]|uniref:class I SAM-dependent DNA methyltransferase n=1 Tax=Nonomuraea sp. H19 TaxID=3452206 RepID=UPI003F88DF9C